MKKIKDKIHYALQSVRNRYPCKIVNIKNYDTTSKESVVVFQSVKAFNISTLTLRSLMEDPLLLEKFHPSDAVKLGFFCLRNYATKNKR